MGTIRADPDTSIKFAGVRVTLVRCLKLWASPVGEGRCWHCRGCSAPSSQCVGFACRRRVVLCIAGGAVLPPRAHFGSNPVGKWGLRVGGRRTCLLGGQSSSARLLADRTQGSNAEGTAPSANPLVDGGPHFSQLSCDYRYQRIAQGASV